MERLQELLQEVRMFDGPENLAENRLTGLYDLVRHIDLPKDQIVIGDVGCYSGTTTELLSFFAKKVYAIDTWETTLEIQDGFRIQKAERLFDEMVERTPNVVKLKCDTILNGANQLEPECFDLLYMDGIHDYESVKARLLAYLPKVKTGGYLAVHDSHFEEVRRAIEEVVGTELKEFHDYSVLYKKPGNLNVVQWNSIVTPSATAEPTPEATPEPTPEVTIEPTPTPIVEEEVKEDKLVSSKKTTTFLSKLD